jgi:hypothetical protein
MLIMKALERKFAKEGFNAQLRSGCLPSPIKTFGNDSQEAAVQAAGIAGGKY